MGNFVEQFRDAMQSLHDLIRVKLLLIDNVPTEFREQHHVDPPHKSDVDEASKDSLKPH
jgi:hypothetical protein